MNAPGFIAAVFLAALVANCAAAPLTVKLRIEREAGGLCVIFDTERTCNYQLRVSTNLMTWQDYGTPVPGNSLVMTQELSQVGLPLAYFTLVATETSQVFSPDEWTFEELVVGKLLFDYEMTSNARFSWSGLTGEWGYLSFGDETASLVFTYDEDDNNAAVYREEVLLTFETDTEGTYRYSEYYRDDEDASSVITGKFDLSSLPDLSG